MKRIYTITIALILVLSLNMLACAEEWCSVIEGEFSVRNGIHFGMNIDEVIELEKNVNALTGENIDDAKKRLYYSVDSLAGIDCNATIYYDFDSEKDGGLYSINYNFGIETGDNYENTKSSLIAKYGNPLYDNNGQVFPIVTPIFKHRLDNLDVVPIGAYSEWVMRFDDCYVVIDLFTETYGNVLQIAYRGVSDLEMKEVKDKEELSQIQLNSDL